MTNNPTLFISYAWETDDLKKWVKDLATQLRNNGIDAKLDQWEVIPGDQIPYFMEKSVRENDFVIIICTPKYSTKSEERIGGVGYEGDIMSAEVLQNSNHRKFIPILKSGTKETSIPTWLKGKYFVDFSSDQHFANNFKDLLTTLLNVREKAPTLGKIQPKFIKGNIKQPETIFEDSEIKIKGILIDEVTQPINDGTRGSGLYQIPFELNMRPSYEWIDLFVNAWNKSSFTSRHRPGIASVYGHKIVLDGTTIEEVEKYHKETLKLAVGIANKTLKELQERQSLIEKREKQRLEEHKNILGDISKRINFDD